MKDTATGKERLYMAVTADRLSLPLAVAESAGELARLRGVKKRTVFSGICISRRLKYPRYIVVDGEEDLPF